MGAHELLAHLMGQGFSLAAEADRLVIRPASLLTEPIRAAVRQAKPELLALLSPSPTQPTVAEALRELSRSTPAKTTTPSAADMAAVGWTDADIARFIERRDRLLMWGWAEAEAEKLADRLVQRDRAHYAGNPDTRVSCTDCKHYRPGRCANHRAAGLSAAEVGRELAGLLQNCAGFKGRP